jgi:hypothetical protein
MSRIGAAISIPEKAVTTNRVIADGLAVDNGRS